MITNCLTKQFTEFVARDHHPLCRVVNCFAISSPNSRPQWRTYKLMSFSAMVWRGDQEFSRHVFKYDEVVLVCGANTRGRDLSSKQPQREQLQIVIARNTRQVLSLTQTEQRRWRIWDPHCKWRRLDHSAHKSWWLHRQWSPARIHRCYHTTSLARDICSSLNTPVKSRQSSFDLGSACRPTRRLDAPTPPFHLHMDRNNTAKTCPLWWFDCDGSSMVVHSWWETCSWQLVDWRFIHGNLLRWFRTLFSHIVCATISE